MIWSSDSGVHSTGVFGSWGLSLGGDDGLAVGSADSGSGAFVLLGAGSGVGFPATGELGVLGLPVLVPSRAAGAPPSGANRPPLLSA